MLKQSSCARRSLLPLPRTRWMISASNGRCRPRWPIDGSANQQRSRSQAKRHSLLWGATEASVSTWVRNRSSLLIAPMAAGGGDHMPSKCAMAAARRRPGRPCNLHHGMLYAGSGPSSASRAPRQAAAFQAAVIEVMFSLLRLCPTYAPYACACPRMEVDACGHIFFPYQWIKAVLGENQKAVSRTIAAPQ